jgi:TonB-dependent receptor-like protein
MHHVHEAPRRFFAAVLAFGLWLAIAGIAQAQTAVTVDTEHLEFFGGTVILKSNTDGVHGSAFAGQRHQYGASIGGPLMHDRLFYFGAFDQQRQYLSVPVDGRVAFGRADFDASSSQHLLLRANDASYEGDNAARSLAAAWSGIWGASTLNDLSSTYASDHKAIGDSTSYLFKNHVLQAGVDYDDAVDLGQKELAVFAQDQWYIRPNVSVSAGARWERLDSPSNAVPNPRVSPRVSVTWSPTSKNIFRAAAGRFLSRHTALPFTNPTDPITPSPVPDTGVFTIDPTFTSTDRYTFGFERQLIAETSVSIDYTHAKSISDAASDPTIDSGITATFRRRFAQSFQAFAQVTYADASSLPLSDQKWRAALDASWDTPWWGLALSGAYRLAAGEQLDLRLGKSFPTGPGKVTLFAGCFNCTNRVNSTVPSYAFAITPGTPRFSQLAARFDF